MEREQLENEKFKRNRTLSYIILAFSLAALIFCAVEIGLYISALNQRKTLTKSLESMKSDNGFLKEHFPILEDEDYYSVYTDDNCQYVDGATNPAPACIYKK